MFLNLYFTRNFLYLNSIWKISPEIFISISLFYVYIIFAFNSHTFVSCLVTKSAQLLIEFHKLKKYINYVWYIYIYYKGLELKLCTQVGEKSFILFINVSHDTCTFLLTLINQKSFRNSPNICKQIKLTSK